MGTRAYCAPSIVCLDRPASFETEVLSLVYTLVAMEFGCALWLRCEDNRDLCDFGPCHRPLPPDESAADLLLRRYLGDPSAEEQEAWWDQRHIEVGRGFDTEALATAHDKVERRRQEEEEAATSRHRQEVEAILKAKQEETKRRDVEAREALVKRQKAEEEDATRMKARRRQAEAEATAHRNQKHQEEQVARRLALNKQGRNLILLLMAGLGAVSLWRRNRR